MQKITNPNDATKVIDIYYSHDNNKKIIKRLEEKDVPKCLNFKKSAKKSKKSVKKSKKSLKKSVKKSKKSH